MDETPGVAQYEKPEYAAAHAMLLESEHGMELLRSVFEGRTDYTLNWLFLSVSGISGSYVNLTDILTNPEQWDEDGQSQITALVVQPRLGRTYKGNIYIRRSDIPWLRQVVQRTLHGIAESQSGNLP